MRIGSSVLLVLLIVGISTSLNAENTSTNAAKHCAQFNTIATRNTLRFTEHQYNLQFRYSCVARTNTSKEELYTYVLTITNKSKAPVVLSISTDTPISIAGKSSTRVEEPYAIPQELYGDLPIFLRQNSKDALVFFIPGLVPLEKALTTRSFI